MHLVQRMMETDFREEKGSYSQFLKYSHLAITSDKQTFSGELLLLDAQHSVKDSFFPLSFLNFMGT